jgi:DNA polymerase (family 10)
MKNALVAKILYEIADLLDMQGVQFKPQAYRKAARSIESLPNPIEEVYSQGKLDELPGIGVNIAKKIVEIIETGSLKYFDELKKGTPIDFESLLAVEGLGPKTVQLLYKKLAIKSLDDLELAAKQHKIRTIKGLGPKVEENILGSIDLARKKKERVRLASALIIAENIRDKLKNLITSGQSEGEVEIAGSVRRMRDSIGDIDILATSNQPNRLADFFTSMPDIRRILEKGETKCSILLNDDVQVDLRLVKTESFGSALTYFTGSKDHNIAVRNMAIKKGYKLNEYGLYKDETQIAGRTETGVYKKLGMDYIPPELRENKGEIEAATNHTLPNLILYDAMVGDLHVHTNWSDGTQPIEEMVQAATQMGYDYVAITDHYSTMAIARGLTERQLRNEMTEIDKISRKFDGIEILKGAELDISSDGSLRVEKKILKELDVVVASVHGTFKQTKKEMTNRLVTAMESGYVNIIGHPTSRKIDEKHPSEIDMEKLFDVSKRTKTYLEINSTPQRLDLNDENVKMAIQAGCKLSIDTDAHNAQHFKNIRLGIGVARRGWAEKQNIINTQPLEELLRDLEK